MRNAFKYLSEAIAISFFLIACGGGGSGDGSTSELSADDGGSITSTTEVAFCIDQVSSEQPAMGEGEAVGGENIAEVTNCQTVQANLGDGTFVSITNSGTIVLGSDLSSDSDYTTGRVQLASYPRCDDVGGFSVCQGLPPIENCVDHALESGALVQFCL